MTGTRRRTTPTLVPFGLGELEALVAGTGPRPAGWHPEYPTADTFDAARMLLLAYEAAGPRPVEPVWWMSAVVVDGEVVGDAGFHGPPSPGGPAEVEIGYQVVPSRRGRGIATRACGLLVAYAWAHGADVVRADTEPGNLASLTVLRANGFARTARGDLAVTRDGGTPWTA